MFTCVCVETHTPIKGTLKAVWDLLAKYVLVAFAKAVCMRIAFAILLKIHLVVKKSVKSLG